MVPCYRGYQRAASNQLSRRADPQRDYFKKSVFLVDTFHSLDGVAHAIEVIVMYSAVRFALS